MPRDNEKQTVLPNSESPAASKPNHAMPIASSAFQSTTGSGNLALDLVIVIDTSGSMADEATSLSKQIDAAIQNSSIKCPSNLRVTYLGIQGIWPGTKFDQPASDYLIKLGVNKKDLQARSPFKESDGIDHAGNKEDLCRAVIDISKYFDWRDDALRAIFVLGDEGMEGGGGKLTNDAIAKNDEAIAVAQAQGVKVFTYQGTPDDDINNPDRFKTINDRDNVTKEYERLAIETDGRPYIYTTGVANFTLVLEEILCESLTPPVIPKVSSDNHGCDKVCDEFDTIMATVNTLANIVMKSINACCGDSSGKSSKQTSGCKCKKSSF